MTGQLTVSKPSWEQDEEIGDLCVCVCELGVHLTEHFLTAKEINREVMNS